MSKTSNADPFGDLKIQDDSALHQITSRTICPTCKRSVRYFCYRCFHVVGMEPSKVPHVHLPVKLNIIKHELEVDGKSTALHSCVLADNVQLYHWGEGFDVDEATVERSLLLFPGPDAKTLEEIPRDSFDRVVVIDGTWKQAKKIVRETTALHKMQKATIAPKKTMFWRFQQLNENHLATIEAIYYFYREFAIAYECKDAEYDGRYDNLLFYYRFFYHLIQQNYIKSQRPYSWRHRNDYIQYHPDQDQEK